MMPEDADQMEPDTERAVVSSDKIDPAELKEALPAEEVGSIIADLDTLLISPRELDEEREVIAERMRPIVERLMPYGDKLSTEQMLHIVNLLSANDYNFVRGRDEDTRPLLAIKHRLIRELYGDTQVYPTRRDQRLAYAPTAAHESGSKVTLVWQGQTIIVRPGYSENDENMLSPLDAPSFGLARDGEGHWHVDGQSQPIAEEGVTIGSSDFHPFSDRAKALMGHVSEEHVKVVELPNGDIELSNLSRYGTVVTQQGYPDPDKYRKSQQADTQKTPKGTIDKAREALRKLF